MNNKFLPIGSVVMLKQATKRVMIIGYKVSNDGINIYDYSACLYPEGLLSQENILCFNHEDIDKIYNIGYSDIEQQNFINRLIDREND